MSSIRPDDVQARLDAFESWYAENGWKADAYDALREEVETLREERDGLEVTLAEQLLRYQQLRESISGETTGGGQEGAHSGPTDPVLVEIEAAFVQWCNAGSPFVNRYFMFERALRERLPEARVRSLFRNASLPRPELLVQTQNPVEYWVVDYEDDHWLLPQPQDAGRFRELAPCFDGDTVSPSALQTIMPARLIPSGEALVVDQPGYVR